MIKNILPTYTNTLVTVLLWQQRYNLCWESNIYRVFQKSSPLKLFGKLVDIYVDMNCQISGKLTEVKIFQKVFFGRATFLDLHWLRIQERIQYKLCVLVFKCKHSLAPAYLSQQLQQVAQLESRQRLRSSSSSAFVVPATRRSALGDRSFSAAGTRAWNSLPPTVTAASTLSSFRRHLKSHLFTKSFPSWQ